MRGSVARTQMNMVANSMVFRTIDAFVIRGKYPVKKIDVNKLIIRILAYSAIKISANIPPLYSTLKPDTSSDSPSAKSNGVRLVSAKLVINQNTNITMIINNGHVIKLVDIRDISIFLIIINVESKISDIETS